MGFELEKSLIKQNKFCVKDQILKPRLKGERDFRRASDPKGMGPIGLSS